MVVLSHVVGATVPLVVAVVVVVVVAAVVVAVVVVVVILDCFSFFSHSRDTMLKLWDADSGRELRSMGGHTGTVTSVVLLPNKEGETSGKLHFICTP